MEAMKSGLVISAIGASAMISEWHVTRAQAINLGSKCWHLQRKNSEAQYGFEYYTDPRKGRPRKFRKHELTEAVATMLNATQGVKGEGK